MARTSGHGNPPWSRDETLLALDLYLSCGEATPSESDARVVALSKELRSLPGSKEFKKNESFRNPAGVAFKLQNLRSISTGRGLGNVSQMDRAVWRDLGKQRAKTIEIATLIRARSAEIGESIEAVDDEEEEFLEGRLLTRMHRLRERSPKLRTRLLKERQATNQIRCDACDAQPPANLPFEIHTAMFEAHHVQPLSETGQTVTRLRDVALLCASCHRLIHRLIATKKRWVGVKELAKAMAE
jgi:5-methylcytosine-specific restriction protein A